MANAPISKRSGEKGKPIEAYSALTLVPEVPEIDVIDIRKSCKAKSKCKPAFTPT